jgi:hypothetical protein
LPRNGNANCDESTQKKHHRSLPSMQEKESPV